MEEMQRRCGGKADSGNMIKRIQDSCGGIMNRMTEGEQVSHL